MAEIQRRKTPTVKIGHVRVGWEVPVLVQSMTNTDTADIAGTIEQVAALALAGSEIVRVTVNNEDAAAAVPHIVEGLKTYSIKSKVKKNKEDKLRDYFTLPPLPLQTKKKQKQYN